MGNTNKHNLQNENKYGNKLRVIEQSNSSVKDELSIAINQKLNNITERVVIMRDVNNEIELETFCNESRRVHPMQFLNRVREFNQFNGNSWKVKL